jgi:hypothetical protein
MMHIEIPEDDIDALYRWLDSVPLSRERKNITRDFSDGGCLLMLTNSGSCRDIALFLPQRCGCA